MKKSGSYIMLSVLVLLISFSCSVKNNDSPAKQEYYEIKIYHLSDSVQEGRVDAFLKDAYLPALHKAGIPSVGVFKPVETDTTYGELIYVFIPYKTVEQYAQLPEKLAGDQVYSDAGKSFVDAPFDNPPYSRHESILLKAFLFMPQPFFPQYTTTHSERIYELRSYESATEAKASKKIEMFNQGGEIALFHKLEFNAVFYGEVLAGGTRPNLMYMTSFSDMKSHDAHWNAFREAPEWKQISGMEEYKNTVSKIYVHLLHPTDYSDF